MFKDYKNSNIELFTLLPWNEKVVLISIIVKAIGTILKIFAKKLGELEIDERIDSISS